jgi:hypothetical protein
MWHAAHPQTSTHPTLPKNLAFHTNACIDDLLPGGSCTHHSSLIARHCLIQSLAKHNRKPMQPTETNYQRPKSIASFRRVFRNCQGKAAELKSLPANSRVFVGLALVYPKIPPVAGSKGHDIIATKLVRLQLLKHGFEVVSPCTCRQILIASPSIRNGRK